MRIFKPQVGGKVWATELHPFKKVGEFVGHIIKVEDQILTFKNGEVTDKLIWIFPKGQTNSYHSFSI